MPQMIVIEVHILEKNRLQFANILSGMFLWGWQVLFQHVSYNTTFPPEQTVNKWKIFRKKRKEVFKWNKKQILFRNNLHVPKDGSGSRLSGVFCVTFFGFQFSFDLALLKLFTLRFLSYYSEGITKARVNSTQSSLG